jgi:hypothetical protein
MLRKYNAEFVRNKDYVVYDHTIPNDELLRQLTVRDEHCIILSHVSNPCDIRIQLYQNERTLNSLMDEMERFYYGIEGATLFDMPLEDARNGRMCAAIFSKDQNWHRCVKMLANI